MRDGPASTATPIKLTATPTIPTIRPMNAMKPPNRLPISAMISPKTQTDTPDTANAVPWPKLIPRSSQSPAPYY